MGKLLRATNASMKKMFSAICASALLFGCSETQPNEVNSVESVLVDQHSYELNLNFISAPRPTGSAHWREVRESSIKQFSKLGYKVEEQNYGSGVNVIAIKQGDGSLKGSIIVSAHYDSTQNCPGADDNASGVAAVLEVARLLSKGNFQRDLVLALWDEEEIDYVGSRAYAKAAKARGEEIHLAIVFEMIGFTSDQPGSQKVPQGLEQIFPNVPSFLTEREGRGDFIALVFNKGAEELVSPLLSSGKSHGLPALGLAVPDQLLTHPGIQDLRRSDHSSFWDVGVPAVMITDTSEFRYPAYHCRNGSDTVDKLNPGFTAKVIQTTADALRKMLGVASK